MKKIIVLFGMFFTISTFAQFTAIPDANFEQELVTQGIDTDGLVNGQIANIDAAAVTNLNVNSKNISSLTGISAFTSLLVLACYDNNISSLDVTSNTALTILYCGLNQMTSLDVTGITTLEELYANENNLTSINTSTNPNLKDYYCYTNQLTSINILYNPLLRELYCWGNQISGIMDLSMYSNLESTNFSDNLISGLVVAANPVLYSLSCENNQINELNVTGLPILDELLCFGNSLTCLNVKNGNNSNFNLFNATNNPSLTCIEVDNVAWSNANWTVAGGNITSGMSFSTNCGTPCTVGVDELESTTASIYPNPTSGQFSISLDVSKSGVLSIRNNIGQLVLQEDFSNTNELKISLEAPKGIYFLHIETDGQLIIKKIVKQ
jgi:hypothetical protein